MTLVYLNVAMSRKYIWKGDKGEKWEGNNNTNKAC